MKNRCGNGPNKNGNRYCTSERFDLEVTYKWRIIPRQIRQVRQIINYYKIFHEIFQPFKMSGKFCCPPFTFCFTASSLY